MLSRERGIRTPGALTPNGFQDRRNRPLCHLSKVPQNYIKQYYLPNEIKIEPLNYYPF